MSRAFVREDSEDRPPRSYHLPARDDPGFDRAAAEALLEGARVGDISAAEEATGHVWGDARLRAYVQERLEWAREKGDERLEQVAERYLVSAGRSTT